MRVGVQDERSANALKRGCARGAVVRESSVVQIWAVVDDVPDHKKMAVMSAGVFVRVCLASTLRICVPRVPLAHDVVLAEAVAGVSARQPSSDGERYVLLLSLRWELVLCIAAGLG